MNVLKSYMFKDKDPVIDVIRTLVQIMAGGRNNLAPTIRQISEDSGVSVGCMYNWFYGATRSPRWSHVAAVAAVLGAPVQVGREIVGRKRADLKLVRGGKA